MIRVPARKNQNGRVTFQSTSKNFRALDTKANSIVFDRRDCCLGDTRKFSQLVLTKLLKLANDANGFTDANRGSALGRAKLTHYGLR